MPIRLDDWNRNAFLDPAPHELPPTLPGARDREATPRDRRSNRRIHCRRRPTFEPLERDQQTLHKGASVVNRA